MNSKDVPLGKILHIIENEAITRPDKTVVAKGAKAVSLENKTIGTLGNPFGPVENPYVPISLNPDVDKTSLVGTIVIAQIRTKRRKRRKKSKRNKKSSN